MKLSNGKVISSTEISHQNPLILIYFAPDCQHCQLLMKQIFSQISTFKDAQMVMVTFEPVQVLPAFEKQFQTSKQLGQKFRVYSYKNIINCNILLSQHCLIKMGS